MAPDVFETFTWSLLITFSVGSMRCQTFIGFKKIEKKFLTFYVPSFLVESFYLCFEGSAHDICKRNWSQWKTLIDKNGEISRAYVSKIEITQFRPQNLIYKYKKALSHSILNNSRIKCVSTLITNCKYYIIYTIVYKILCSFRLQRFCTVNRFNPKMYDTKEKCTGLSRSVLGTYPFFKLILLKFKSRFGFK